ncbi:MAG TPA: VWA domain-containing protein [Terracidiphilus sp.]|nr:VWA domain-containing protein [Terracidiphilus sp.]
MNRWRVAAALLLAGLAGLPVGAASGSAAANAEGNRAAAAEAPTATFRLEVRRVPLDVVVLDKQGNPVRGLKKSDFTVKEDGKTQRILSFGYEDGSVPSYVPGKLPALPPNTFINLPREPEQGPLYVLYYDMVNTPTTQQMEARKQLLDFVDHAQPGTRFALFVNMAGLHLIEGFTSDHAQLRTAILRKGPGPHVPNVFIYGRNYGYEDAGAALSNLKFIAEYLNGIPGKKDLLWLAGEFPIPVGPTMSGLNSDTGVGGGFSSSTMQINDLTYLESQAIKETYAAMEKSQVALCPVDLNGVRYGGLNSAGGDVIANYSHEAEIAAATGGHAYYGNNRLTELLDKAVANGMSYYSLTYSPTNMKYDGLERHIEVTLAKKNDYTLSYRKLYYALPDDSQEPQKKVTLQSRFLAAKSADTLFANIEHGAPMLHDLLFSAQVTAMGVPEMATTGQMEALEGSPAYFKTRRRNKPQATPKAVKLQRYRIAYGVFDPLLKKLAVQQSRPASLEFAAAAYDADGKLLNSMLNEGLATLPAEAGSKPGAMPRPGALFHGEQELDVPPGAAWLRVAVRDRLSDRTGTLEIRLPLRDAGQEAASAKP